MDYETQVLTTELDNYREDLVKAFDYLREYPQHTHVKMPYYKETSELLRDFVVYSEKTRTSDHHRVYDQQQVFGQLVNIFTNSVSNISAENATKLAGYVADILNESYKSEFFNPNVFNLKYSIWFKAPSSNRGNIWHLDRNDGGICTDEKLAFLYTIKGPSTLFFDTKKLIKGFKEGMDYRQKKYYDADLYADMSDAINYLENRNYSPVDIQYGSAGYANIHHQDNSAHGIPIQQGSRMLLMMNLEAKNGIYGSRDYFLL